MKDTDDPFMLVIGILAGIILLFTLILFVSGELQPMSCKETQVTVIDLGKDLVNKSFSVSYLNQSDNTYYTESIPADVFYNLSIGDTAFSEVCTGDWIDAETIVFIGKERIEQ